MKLIVALFSGFIFALGLGISGMTQPQKVIGFLDIFGQWNPALAFVMIGAIGVHALTYFFITKRTNPILDNKFHVPTNISLDKNLIFGAVLFGAGWGLGGFCPGPALASLAVATQTIFMFVFSMLFGFLVFRMLRGLKWL